MAKQELAEMKVVAGEEDRGKKGVQTRALRTILKNYSGVRYNPVSYLLLLCPLAVDACCTDPGTTVLFRVHTIPQNQRQRSKRNHQPDDVVSNNNTKHLKCRGHL